MTIDFEKDQEEVLDKTTNINKLADKIKELQAHQQQLEVQEDAIKQKKKEEHGFHSNHFLKGHKVFGIYIPLLWIKIINIELQKRLLN